jgi:hypothetical protein
MNNAIHIMFMEKMIAHAQQVEADAVALEAKREALNRTLTPLELERQRLDLGNAVVVESLRREAWRMAGARAFTPEGFPSGMDLKDFWKVSRL